MKKIGKERKSTMQNMPITGRVMQIFRFTQKAGYVETYARDYSALSFRIKGKSRFIEREGDRLIGKGDVLLVPAGVSYVRQVVEEEEIIVFHFSSLETIGGEIMSYRGGEGAEKYRHLFDRALAVWEQRDAGYHYAVTALFYEILALASKDATASYHSGSAQADAAAQMMQKEFSDPRLTVKAVAKRLYISEVYLRRIFHAAYGVSPKQYIDAMRMEHAKALLKSGYYTHREIARRCGFEDVKYFRTAFKRHARVTPAEYARRAQENSEHP